MPQGYKITYKIKPIPRERVTEYTVSSARIKSEEDAIRYLRERHFNMDEEIEIDKVKEVEVVYRPMDELFRRALVDEHWPRWD